MPENNKPLQDLRLSIIDVKYQLAKMFNDNSFTPVSEDFDDLIRLREELKNTITVSKVLFERWIARKVR